MNDHTPDHTRDHTPDRDETWESEMTSAFDRRVRELHEAPHTLESIQGRARGIQRARRAAAGCGVLAAAAVVAPVAFLVIDGLNETADRGPRIAAPTPNTTAPPAPAPAWIEGRDYHRTDGSVVRLPTAYDDAVTLGDGQIVATRNDGGMWTVDVVEGGNVVDTYEAYTGFTVADSGSMVAFVTTDGELQTLWASGERVLVDGFADNDTAVAATGDNCAETCQVFVGNGETAATTVVGADGTRGPVKGTVRGLQDVRGDLATVIDSVGDDLIACTAVVDMGSGARSAETCNYVLDQLSPDSRHVLATDSYGSGPGSPFVAVVDAATGEETGRYEPAGGGFVATGIGGWVDDDTATILAWDKAGWHVYALETTGKVTEAAGPAAGLPGDSPLHPAH